MLVCSGVALRQECRRSSVPSFFLTAVLGVALVGFVWRRPLMFFLAVGGELLEHLLHTASQMG